MPLFHYTPADVQADIARELLALPADKKGAIVAHADTDKNVTLSLLLRTGNDWYVAAEGFYAPTSGFTGQVEVLHTWG